MSCTVCTLYVVASTYIPVGATCTTVSIVAIGEAILIQFYVVNRDWHPDRKCHLCNPNTTHTTENHKNHEQAFNIGTQKPCASSSSQLHTGYCVYICTGTSIMACRGNTLGHFVLDALLRIHIYLLSSCHSHELKDFGKMPDTQTHRHTDRQIEILQ